MVLELCVSDRNKPLLLLNSAFLPYLVDALLLQPDHPRAQLKPEQKAWIQTCHSECLAQLALFPQGREALLADQSVLAALQVVAGDGGFCAEARKFAQTALLVLSDKQQQEQDTGGGEWDRQATDNLHIMISYNWNVQATMQRLNASLLRRNYRTWFDLTNMKGSTVEAMASAIEMAAVFVFGVSLACE
jgi:hypothetical protein